MALTKVHNDLLLAMDNQKVSLFVALDLSAAFDTVDHNILKKVLERQFGLTGLAHRWFGSYLESRSQRVKVDNTFSGRVELKYGVPQGSSAGPVLYNMYASTLSEVFKKFDIAVMGYADDHALYSSPCVDKENISSTFANIEVCLKEVKKWMGRNWLMMNEQKTEFVAFGRRNVLANLSFGSISVGDEPVDISSAVKYLGVWLDNTLDMKKFISDICRIASLKLYNIRKIKKYLSRESLVRLVNALVLSHLDYSNALLFGLPDSTIRPMQNIQNSAARLILGLSKFEHITPALQQVHWLPIRYRIQFKLMTFVYKAVRNEAPEYIRDLIELKQSNYSLRSVNGTNLSIRRSHLKSCGDRAFSVCAPKLWNSLPSEVRTSETVHLFKKRHKTFYFKLAFNIL
eukprot:Seg2209.5 transcript_id=Seg2209.5/GoldUCD/mRNA.D3Y31 product="putative RNA-directed DNA polymerase from transposon X-element" pseudo=true protein_id=Seg2209.5/GoldUCD/D3Y31